MQVLIRLLLLIALGAIGCACGYWALYVGLPAIAALLISQKGSARYLAEDAPRVVRVLRWMSAAYAYVWLLTDTFPVEEGNRGVDLEIDVSGTPSAASALLRLVYSIPAVVLLCVLSITAGLAWLIGAVVILVRQRLPIVIADVFSMMLCYQFRLVGYHLSLVDRYPSFDAPVVGEDHPGPREESGFPQGA